MMKKLLLFSVCCGLVAAPLPVAAAASGPGATVPSLLEAAELAAASGAYRIQNTSTITTGRIRPGDKKRSAIAYGLSGLMAFTGAALWRWIPCRNATLGSPGEAVDGVTLAAYNKCYDADGERKGFDTPTKWMLGAGIGLEAVALGYLIAHLMQDGDDR